MECARFNKEQSGYLQKMAVELKTDVEGAIQKAMAFYQTCFEARSLRH